jgi:hypothetical protein
VTILLALAGFYALAMLVRYGRRGVLAAWPGLVSSRSSPGGPPPTPAQEAAVEALAPLGFHRLGSRVEDGPLHGLALRSECLADGPGPVFADLFEAAPPGGRVARVQFLTTFPGGVAVLTANHGRKERAGRGGEVQALPGASLDRVVAAHRAAVDRLAAVHGAPVPATSLEARDAAARAWYRGIGGAEIRGRFAPYLGNAVFAAGVLAFCVVSLVRSRP